MVMAAAPADFRPATYAPGKIKKSDDGVAPTIELVTNPDIAAELGQRKRPEQVLVVFAAETGDAEANGRAKLARKRADLIVVNEVGPDKVFGADTNAADGPRRGRLGAAGCPSRPRRTWPTPSGISSWRGCPAAPDGWTQGATDPDTGRSGD